MNRLIGREEREEQYLGTREQIKIGIVGVGAGVGCSFLAMTLAYMFSADRETSISYLQADEKYSSDIYDSLGMDKRFINRQFVDFYDVVREKKNIRGLKNIEEYINWVIISPKSRIKDKKPTQLEILKLISNISCDMLICDLGNKIVTNRDERTYYQELIAIFDVIICVIDPLPSKLLSNSYSFALAKESEVNRKNVIWVVNKCNEGVNKRILNNFLKVKEAIKIVNIDSKFVYRAEYNCKILASDPKVKLLIENECNDIIKKIHSIVNN